MSVVTLDLDGATHAAEARVGDIVVVSVAENPTTGFLWHQVNPLPTGVVERETEFSPAGAGLGAGGMRRFVFSSDRIARAELDFHLSRSWEPNKIIQKRNALVVWRGERSVAPQ
jgi:predicted secreted protein